MNKYVEYYHEFKGEVERFNQSEYAFIGVAKTIARFGSIEDLQALVKAHDDDIKRGSNIAN